jgi:adenylate cyclase class IV
MATNVEIKARLSDPEAVRRAAERLGDAPPIVLHQDDVFYRVPRGRLKLRRSGSGTGELIHYERADEAGPKASRYRIYPVADPAALDAVLSAALGVRGRVRKQRTLLHAGTTRIHLDEVEGLGSFVELEVVLAPGEEAASGRRVAADLMLALGIAPGDLVAGAYLDLLARETAGDCSAAGPGTRS